MYIPSIAFNERPKCTCIFKHIIIINGCHDCSMFINIWDCLFIQRARTLINAQIKPISCARQIRQTRNSECSIWLTGTLCELSQFRIIFHSVYSLVCSSFFSCVLFSVMHFHGWMENNVHSSQAETQMQMQIDKNRFFFSFFEISFVLSFFVARRFSIDSVQHFAFIAFHFSLVSSQFNSIFFPHFSHAFFCFRFVEIMKHWMEQPTENNNNEKCRKQSTIPHAISIVDWVLVYFGVFNYNYNFIAIALPLFSRIEFFSLCFFIPSLLSANWRAFAF